MRYSTDEFPTYAHLPGKTIHPNKPGGHSYGKAEPVALEISDQNYREHKEFLMGLDLFNHAYFWEAHVYWEACWHAVGRKGAIADLLKALILLSAGNLKLKVGQAKPALGHWKRSCELLTNLSQITLLGLHIGQLQGQIQQIMDEKNTIVGGSFQILLD